METCRPTTHTNPTYVVDGVSHYCVANIPGAVPRTSTFALTNATLPYVVEISELGWEEASRVSPEVAAGVNIVDGRITYPGVAEAWELPLADLSDLI